MANSTKLPNTWIFQANPNRYRIEDSLKTENQEYWNLRQHAKKISVGDRVLIWISGKSAGIYGLGTVKTVPELMSDSPQGLHYWRNDREGRQLRLRALVHYEQTFLEHPLLKVFLRYDPLLSEHKIIRAPRGTNFEVSETEWIAIKSWLDAS